MAIFQRILHKIHSQHIFTEVSQIEQLVTTADLLAESYRVKFLYQFDFYRRIDQIIQTLNDKSTNFQLFSKLMKSLATQDLSFWHNNTLLHHFLQPEGKKWFSRADWLTLTNLVKPEEATKVGQLTGAKIIATGSVVQVEKKLYLTAKVIGTETSRVVGAKGV